MKMKNENNSFDLAISYYREEKSFTESRNKKNNKNCGISVFPKEAVLPTLYFSCYVSMAVAGY